MRNFLKASFVVWTFLFLSSSVLGDTPPPKVTIGPVPNGLSISGQKISIGLASNSSIGALSATDWNTFNSKQSVLTLGNLTSPTTGVTVGGGTGAVVGSGTTVSIQTASGTQPGLLSSTDWTTFNNKQPAGSYALSSRLINTTSPLTGGGDLTADRTLAIPASTNGVDGYLTAADHTTFAAKQSSLTFGNLTDVGTDGITITGSLGSVIGAGTTISQHVADTTHAGYLASADWNTFNNKQASGNYLTAISGDVVVVGSGSSVATIQPNVVSNSKLAQMPAHTHKGNNTGSPANALDLTQAQLTADLNLFTASLQGVVPASGGSTANFLRADGTWAAPAGSGSGTVNSVSGVNANGFSFAITNPTTTPAITLSTTSTGVLKGSLGQLITATSGVDYLPASNPVFTGNLTGPQIGLTGTIGAANLSGSNSGDISLNAVGAAPSANGATLAGQSLTLQPADGTHPGLLTSIAQTIGGAKAFLANITGVQIGLTGTIGAANFSGSSSGSNTGDQTITLSSDVVGSGTSGITTTIQPNVVSNSKLAQMTAHTYKGNNTGSTANAADVTSTQLTADLNLFSNTLQGLVPASGGGTTNFLRADGTFAAPTGSSGLTAITGDVVVIGSGSSVATIQPNAVTTLKLANSSVTYAKIQNVSANSTLLGAGSAGAGAAPTEISLGTGLTMTGTTLSSSSGGGNVTGPGSSTNRAISTYNGTAGTSLFDNPNATIDLNGAQSIASLHVNGTAGQGYVEYVSQASKPLTPPANSVRVYSNSTGRISFEDSTGFSRSYDGPITGDRLYNFPDVSGDTVTLNAATQSLSNKTLVAVTLSGTTAVNNTVLNSVANVTYFGEVDDGLSGTSKTLDWTQGGVQKITLNGSVAFSFINPIGPARLQVKMIQNSTGGWIVNSWPASVKWPTAAPIPTSTANAIDIITLWFDGINYFATDTQNFQ